MTSTSEGLPDWVQWQERPFPDANLLYLPGHEPALVDSGFVGHAADTAQWVRARTDDLHLVVNTHWHSDHVGGNSALQSCGAGIAASSLDADAIARRDPGCCLVEYLDQPVAPYTVDVELQEGQELQLGDHHWQVLATPGHTPGHLCLWQPEERLLAVGDALSTYDVGWVNLALDGPDAARTALESLQRIAALEAAALLTAHGPRPTDPQAALDAALRRAQRLCDDPDGAVWYGARRIFAFALIIHGGVPTASIDTYLLAQPWLQDAARLLTTPPEQLADELVTGMTTSGAVRIDGDRLAATAAYAPVDPTTLKIPAPSQW